ncbi:hypothetical protein QYE76_059078 [Lolium multiflorum]|uniref:F-box domain-containing protein n=1 Tax=Lolium multiflorum TaxID=4521 RepID=A0AAD8T7T6_LOLMU|nr:hypothetical protein QYE76_059078 [Lolium multiflorum]
MLRSRWPDLPPELLHEISSRLHDSTDFVRFHAVCKPWRSTHDPTFARKTTSDQFQPWLLAPNETGDYYLKLRFVFSKKSSYLAPSPIPGTARNWVTRADGTGVCYFTSNSPAGPTLHDALTGTAMASLPAFRDGQWEEDNPNGIIYNDGTVLVYTKHGNSYSEGQTANVRAALFRPGDKEWTVVKRTMDSPYYGEYCVAYHAGKILVTVERSLWQVVVPLTTTTTPPSTAGEEFLQVLRPSSLPLDEDGYFYEYSHVLESRGELLWASVHISVDYPYCYRRGVRGLTRALSVFVHSLEEAPVRRWVPKKGASLADRVLFLGWPNSFAVDASRLGMTAGGFVYFLYDNDKGTCLPHKRRGVFRYNLMNNTTKFIQWLPKGWDNEMCTWLIPQPVIAPILHKDMC